MSKQRASHLLQTSDAVKSLHATSNLIWRYDSDNTEIKDVIAWMEQT